MIRSGTARALARVATVLLLVAFSAAFALEPPTKEQLERYRRDGTMAARAAQARSYGNHRFAPRLVSRLKERLAPASARRTAKGLKAEAEDRVAAPPAAWAGLPTKGTVKVLALLIAFSDYPPTTPAATFASRLFGDGQGSPPFDSLRNYYRRSSYSQLEIQGNVLGWYTTSYARSSVTETDAGRQSLIEEALTYYNQQGHDFTQYDNDGDGVIDYFCVFWTGPHGEWASFWWGYDTGFYDSSFRLDGKRLGNYSWQWELYNYPNGTFSPSTIIHETGHALGVPDYYDYDDTVGPPGGVGGLDIMDGTAGDHNCFSKFMLDWISPTVVPAGPRTASLRASGLYPDAALFMPGATSSIFDEYFMVQNRMRTANDAGLFTASDGLLVWHVDARLNSYGTDFLYDNSYTAHKLLRLMEADGLEEIERYGWPADAGDYYKEGSSLGPTGTPNTTRYDGTPTAMGVTNIVGTTSPMSLDIYSNDLPPTCALRNITDGQTIYGTVTVEVDATDDSGIRRVELYLDDVLEGTLTAPPFTFTVDTTSVPNGSRRLRAVAYDEVLQTGTASAMVTVDNIYPVASLAAKRVLNRGALLREYIDVLTWNESAGNTTDVKFRVYVLDGGRLTLLAEVPKGTSSGPFQYLRRGVSGSTSYTYSVAAVGGQDREGAPVSVSVR
ncbi:MAG TPA: M6 family metalloprotease domain-containing protein [Terriglobales bacterium]|nr:M6 family metalloprotease domain-containing protein [Terriglobales bacterium]